MPISQIPPSGPITAHAFRLSPNDNLKESLLQHAQIIFARLPNQNDSAIFTMTAVGSLKDVTLRLANASRRDNVDTKAGDGNGNGNGNGNGESVTTTSIENKSKSSTSNEIRRWQERFEIVSLVGTFSRDGSCHLHLSISDQKGNTFGGHLIAGVVFTTVEVVVGSIDGVTFDRELDDETGYGELAPKQRKKHDSWTDLASIAKAAFFIFVGFSIYPFITSKRR